MTSRARWLLILAFVGLMAGVTRSQITLSLLSLAIFVWVLGAWLQFQFRVHFGLPRVRFQRLVNGRQDPSGVLWAGRPIRIDLCLSSSAKIHAGLVVRDVVPEILAPLPQCNTNTRHDRPANRFFSPRSEAASDRSPNQWTLQSDCRQTEFTYWVVALAAGQVALPGLRLTLQDQYGWFELHRFLPLAQKFRILPDYFRAGELKPIVKRQNSLPRHGIHRLQRAGAGSELLDLREYVPGDPPKSIAWKVSARRDRLMTRKYESEVPVRVHLIVDGSIMTRSGGYGKRLLDQLNQVAASVARAATSVGDPISGLLIDESHVQRLPWLAGDRGFLDFVKSLADFAHTMPPPLENPPTASLESGLRVCHERFPELMDGRYLRIPWSFVGGKRKRYRVVGVLAEVYQLSPKEQAECYYDDRALAVRLQRLLFDAGLSWMTPLHTPVEDTLAAGARGMQLISREIAGAIAHARDNEVFVVLADLLTTVTNLRPFLRVTKLALAKHHRVVVVCPTTTFQRPDNKVVWPSSNTLANLLWAAEQARIRESAIQLKRELIRLGASVSFAGEQSAVQMVLAEMDLARDGKTRIAGPSLSAKH